MTPVNFSVFLFSLLLVDLRYTIARSHLHTNAQNKLPAWLHNLIYRPQPYSYMPGNNPNANGQWYYHTKQKKLMKMEAAEAFELRNTVLVLLAAVLSVLAGSAWYLTSYVYNGLMTRLAASGMA